jgi:hypothetical protein
MWPSSDREYVEKLDLKHNRYEAQLNTINNVLAEQLLDNGTTIQAFAEVADLLRRQSWH